MIKRGVEPRIDEVGQQRRVLRGATVAVVESAEVGDGDDLARTVFNLARQGRVAFEAQMATSLVVEQVVTIPPITRS